MPEIGTSGLMSGERKRSVAAWPKLPRLSSTLLAHPGYERSTSLRAKRSDPIHPSFTRRLGLLRRFAPLRKRFAFVTGNDGGHSFAFSRRDSWNELRHFCYRLAQQHGRSTASQYGRKRCGTENGRGATC